MRPRRTGSGRSGPEQPDPEQPDPEQPGSEVETADEDTWRHYLNRFHENRPGAIEAVLADTVSGDHNPYRWLARAVSGPVRTVLDLGCGSGPMSRELTTEDRTVIGLDTSAAELKVAAERGPGPWIRGDMRRLPLADASVDAVISSVGLVMVPNLSEALAEVARVLRPGGLLATIAPALRPVGLGDLRVLSRITARLHTLPQFPGAVEKTGFTAALTACGLRRVEDARERYGFWVTSRADAERVMWALYLPSTRWSKVEAAIEHLEDRLSARGPFQLAVPMRRLVAIK